MVRITDLDRVGIKLSQGLTLGLPTHPVKLLNAYAVGHFDMGYECRDFFFRIWRKEFLGIQLSNAEAHRSECAEALAHTKISTTHSRDRALPAHLLLLLTRQNVVVQLKIRLRKRI